MALDIQGCKPQGMTFETRAIALDEILVAVGFDGLLQPQVGDQMVGRIHAPAQVIHRLSNGRLRPLSGQGEGQITTNTGQAPTIGSHRTLRNVFLDLDLLLTL